MDLLLVSPRLIQMANEGWLSLSMWSFTFKETLHVDFYFQPSLHGNQQCIKKASPSMQIFIKFLLVS